eukprot:5165903-Amphidinium_carterae.1
MFRLRPGSAEETSRVSLWGSCRERVTSQSLKVHDREANTQYQYRSRHNKRRKAPKKTARAFLHMLFSSASWGALCVWEIVTKFDLNIFTCWQFGTWRNTASGERSRWSWLPAK